jgi:hypothetical protein
MSAKAQAKKEYRNYWLLMTQMGAFPYVSDVGQGFDGSGGELRDGSRYGDPDPAEIPSITTSPIAAPFHS